MDALRSNVSAIASSIPTENSSVIDKKITGRIDMKVIRTDNFNRDYIDDMLMDGPGLSKEEAEAKKKEYNAKNLDDEDWYIVVEDDYKLKEFKP